jgi:hypothetical protein
LVKERGDQPLLIVVPFTWRVTLLHAAVASLSVFPSFGSAKVRFLFRLSSKWLKIFLFILPVA